MNLTAAAISISLPEDALFFDWASASPLSKNAQSVLSSFHEEMNGAWDMPAFIRKKTDELEGARNQIAQLINAKSASEIIFVRSATEGINTVANGLAWTGKEEVIVSDLEHPANVMPWLRIAQVHGCQVLRLDSDESGVVNLEQLSRLVSRKTRLVAISHVSYLHGTIQPIREIAEIISSYGTLLLVDAAQSVGRIPVDVGDLHCSFLVASGRKALLSPLGSGFLYIDNGLIDSVVPSVWGTRAASLLDRAALRVTPGPRRLEGNLPDMASLFAMASNAQGFVAVDLSVIHRHILSTSRYFIQQAGRIRGASLPIQYSPAIQSGIHTLVLNRDPINAKSIESRLRRRNIVVAADAKTIRVSFHVSNAPDQVDQLILALEEELTSPSA